MNYIQNHKNEQEFLENTPKIAAGIEELPEFNGNFFKYLMKHSRKREVIAKELKILPGSLKTYYQFREKQVPANVKLAIIHNIDKDVINLLLTEYEKEKINIRNEELKRQYELEQQKQSKRSR